MEANLRPEKIPEQVSGINWSYKLEIPDALGRLSVFIMISHLYIYVTVILIVFHECNIKLVYCVCKYFFLGGWGLLSLTFCSSI